MYAAKVLVARYALAAIGIALAIVAQSLIVPPAVASLTKARIGTIQHVRVRGSSLEGALSGYPAVRDVAIYLPPSYGSRLKRRYPVVYALHGFGSSGKNWPGFLGAPKAFDQAIAAGGAEMIIVMPNAMTPLGGSMFSSSMTTGDWETFIARDLVRWVDSNYRTIASSRARGLVGFSMGGYGVLRIAMKHPDVFSSIYAMSSCCLAPQVAPVPATGALDGFAALEKIKTPEEAAALGFGAAPLAMAAAWSPNPNAPPLYFDLPTKNGVAQPDVIAAWSANAILTMVHQYVPALRSLGSIAIDVGLQDFLLADNQRLHELLGAYHVMHSFQTYEGGHGDKVAARFQTEVLPFFSRKLIVRMK